MKLRTYRCSRVGEDEIEAGIEPERLDPEMTLFQGSVGLACGLDRFNTIKIHLEIPKSCPWLESDAYRVRRLGAFMLDGRLPEMATPLR